jgi:diaminohydroxyphosphoribosylaminopyrimidine deaminase/5-amino-6-(5-phosphoribosylamino)uracil reductase
VLNGEAATIIVTRQGAPEANLGRLRSAGVRILGMQDNDGRIDLRCLLGELGEMGIHNVLLEGGGELAASMIAAGLVDRGLIFIAPKIVGGRDAKSPVEGDGIESMADALPTSKPRIRRFGDDVALKFDFWSAERTLTPDPSPSEGRGGSPLTAPLALLRERGRG